MNKVDLKMLFSGLQNQMSAQLNTNREFILHPGSKGDSLENAWIEWLRKYLPNRYSVDKAIVIDHEGNTSQQIDIVIYDSWFTPFIFNQNGFYYIPAEGVKFVNGGKVCPPRALTKILGGILCSTNSFSKEDTIKTHFQKLESLQTIDLGCIADYGSFYVDYTPNQEITEAGQNAYLEFYSNRKFKDLHFSDKEHSFVTFFMQLTRYLQQAIGTIPAIDLNAYLNSIGEKVDEQI